MAEKPALKHLIAQATNLAGGNACAAGHDWQSDGGARACPKYDDPPDCSQTVYVCRRCGAIDYGEPGGPGFIDCEEYCDFKE